MLHVEVDWESRQEKFTDFVRHLGLFHLSPPTKRISAN